MKLVIVVGGMVVGVIGVYVGSRLSDDALALTVGFLLGVMSSIPASLLLLASQRRQERREPREQQPGVPMIVLPYSGHVNYPPPESQTIEVPRLPQPPKTERIEW